MAQHWALVLCGYFPGYHNSDGTMAWNRCQGSGYPQMIETAVYGLPWRLGWLFVASLRAHDCEVVALWSKMRECERVVKTLCDGHHTRTNYYWSRALLWTARHCRRHRYGKWFWVPWNLHGIPKNSIEVSEWVLGFWDWVWVRIRSGCGSSTADALAANVKTAEIKVWQVPCTTVTVASYHEGKQWSHVLWAIRWWSGGILKALALVDTGDENSVSCSSVNDKETTHRSMIWKQIQSLPYKMRLP